MSIGALAVRLFDLPPVPTLHHAAYVAMASHGEQGSLANRSVLPAPLDVGAAVAYALGGSGHGTMKNGSAGTSTAMWLPAAVSGPTRTMSQQELRKSAFLAGLDVFLFFSSGLVASCYWCETRGRVSEVRRRGLNADSLALRSVLLSLLAAANLTRGFGLVVDAEFHLLFSRRAMMQPHHTFHQFKHWIDHVASSFPTLVFMSMLSVLLMYLVEIFYRTQLQAFTLIRPTIIFLNVLAYLLYITIALVTLHILTSAAYTTFREFVFALFAVVHLALCTGFLSYGCGLWCRLRRRARGAEPSASGMGPSSLLINRVALFSTLLPFSEIMRMFLDLEYSLGGVLLPITQWQCGPSDVDICNVLIVAALKLCLEWFPSVALLYAFRPDKPRAQGEADYGAGAEPGDGATPGAVFLSPGNFSGLGDPLLDDDGTDGNIISTR